MNDEQSDSSSSSDEVEAKMTKSVKKELLEESESSDGNQGGDNSPKEQNSNERVAVEYRLSSKSEEDIGVDDVGDKDL